MVEEQKEDIIEESAEDLTENDEISAGEEAFMEGYDTAEDADEKEPEDEKPVDSEEE